MFSSMTADICDEDELVTGLRREGAFVAVGGFFGKVAQVATLLLAGALPRMAGYLDTSVPPTLRELKVMRAILIGVQFVAILAAITIIWFYPSRAQDLKRHDACWTNADDKQRMTEARPVRESDGSVATLEA